VTEPNQDQPDPRRYLRLIWRRKWILLAVVVLIPAAVYALSSRLAKTYQATTTLNIKQAPASSSLFSNEISWSTSNSAEAARLIRTTVVAREAANRLDEPVASARSLLDDIEVDVDESQATNFLTIVARADDPDRAAEVANAFASSVATTRTNDSIASIDETIATLTSGATAPGGNGPGSREALGQQLQELRALRASQASATQVVEPAAVPNEPISPRPVRNAAVAFVLALLVAGGLTAMLERLDRRLHDTDELEDLVGAPLLAMIPDSAFPGRVPRPHVREAFQTLRAGLTYFNVDRSLTSIIVASPTHGDGKTTVATNLAIALAQDERNVILVDGDLRRPQVVDRLGLGDKVYAGIDTVLTEHTSVDDALVPMNVEGGQLWVLPAIAPPPNPSVLLGSKRMRSVAAELAERAEIVVIDTPPILSVSDAIPLLKRVSGIVLVARVDYTSRDAIKRARQVIVSAGGNLLGVVATGTQPGGLYGHDEYGYGAGYEADEDEGGLTARPSDGARRVRSPVEKTPVGDKPPGRPDRHRRSRRASSTRSR
jgi:capsular exopolysaccharide synthesis family protein